MKTINFYIENRTAYLQFDNPPGNILNIEMSSELANLIDTELIGNSDFEKLVISGNYNNFMFGANINDFILGESKKLTKQGRYFMRNLQTIPHTVISIVDGYALGAGTEITLASDYVIATENPKFGLPEIHFGLFPGAGGTQLLPQRVGYKKATEIILMGKNNISSLEAHSIGLIDFLFSNNSIKEEIIKNLPLKKRTYQSNHTGNSLRVIAQTYNNLKTKFQLNNIPEYAIQSAVECLNRSVKVLDFDFETKQFEYCLQQTETYERIDKFISK